MIYIVAKSQWVEENIATRLRGQYYDTKFANRPTRLRIGENVKIFHPEYIFIGDNVDIAMGAALCPLHSHHGRSYPSRITIGNNVHFGSYDRIASMDSVTIEDDVLFAAFVHVTDHSHEYRKIGIPVAAQNVFSKGPVVIKRGAWLAFGLPYSIRCHHRRIFCSCCQLSSNEGCPCIYGCGRQSG